MPPSVEAARLPEGAALGSEESGTSPCFAHQPRIPFLPRNSQSQFHQLHSSSQTLGPSIHPLADFPFSSILPAIHPSKLLTSNIVNQRENLLFPLNHQFFRQAPDLASPQELITIITKMVFSDTCRYDLGGAQCRYSICYTL